MVNSFIEQEHEESLSEKERQEFLQKIVIIIERRGKAALCSYIVDKLIAV